MRVTVFELDSGEVRPRVTETPPWKTHHEHEGEPLTGVAQAGLVEVPRAQTQLVHIGVGGHYVMHATPELAYCQIVRGRGVLRLPDGRELGYAGPELYIFHPETLHEWDQVTEDTLLSVCLVRAPERP